jgi:hypothetical protein
MVIVNIDEEVRCLQVVLFYDRKLNQGLNLFEY